MPRRLVLTFIAIGLTTALIAAPVSAGGGSLSIGDSGADGEIGDGFRSFDGTIWDAVPFCETGIEVFIPDVLDRESRFALEFPLTGLPANATITSATLGVRSIHGAAPGQTAIHGYAGDGGITAADVQVSGTPVLFTPVTTQREDHDVTSLMTPAMVSAGWAGFSFRQDPPVDDVLGTWDCPDSIIFPILTITYDLPNPPTPVASGLPDATPVASGMPDAAMNRSADTSSLLALGFAALLLGSLGTLAYANARRR